MEGFLWSLFVLIGLPTVMEAFDCLRDCNFDKEHPLVAPEVSEELCLVTLPDNPRQNRTTTFPCQIEIQANCTSFCQVHLHFFKFNLEPCKHNLTHFDDICNQVNSCEYVVLREHGVDMHGAEVDEIARFHGDMTEEVYVSQTNKVLLQFCYRSETFTARNLQITYRTEDPNVETPINWGPPAVYVLGTFVVLFIIAIIMVQWCPWLRPCLDPVPQKDSLMMDL